MLWDIGTYRVREGNPAEGFRRGKIPLELEGKKLKGEWVLVRTRQGQETKESWLLIKTGTDARPISPRQDDRSVLSGRSMQRIATDKESAQWIGC
jgi:bifunctional non-homologous end joining protein LigD